MSPDTGHVNLYTVPSTAHAQPWALLHDGATGSFQSFTMIVPAKGLAVCVATNAGGMGVGKALYKTGNALIRNAIEGRLKSKKKPTSRAREEVKGGRAQQHQPPRKKQRQPPSGRYATKSPY
jgi:hypothetical protein